MWIEEEGEIEKWFIRKRKNASGSCHFVLPSPLAFSQHRFQWLLHFSSKNCFSVLHKMRQRWKRLDQPGVFPLISGVCIWYVILPQTLCFLSSLTYTSPLCFIFPLTLLRPLLETTQASSFSVSPLHITSSGKACLLNCTRRVLGEKRNKEFIR